MKFAQDTRHTIHICGTEPMTAGAERFFFLQGFQQLQQFCFDLRGHGWSFQHNLHLKFIEPQQMYILLNTLETMAQQGPAYMRIDQRNGARYKDSQNF